MTKDFRIEIADTKEKYEGLRALWCEVFGDEPEFVDAMYENFADAIKGYVVCSPEGEVISALSCFPCGEYMGRPVYVSYAICTRDDMRGLGIAGRLVERARDDVLGSGGISLISPAEPSLEEFYGAHGYTPHFFVNKHTALIDFDEDFMFDEEDEEYEKADPGLHIEYADYAKYNKFREALLSTRPHVSLSDDMLRLIHAESKLPGGESGLLIINGGDAICALSVKDYGMLEIEELILNPVLEELSLEIGEEIACRIAEHFGTDAILYRTPGHVHCQSMAAGLPDEAKSATLDADIEDDYRDGEYIYKEAYYGFPVE